MIDTDSELVGTAPKIVVVNGDGELTDEAIDCLASLLLALADDDNGEGEA